MSASTAARRQAAALVQAASDDRLDGHLNALIGQARENPARVVEMLVVLATTVAVSMPVRPAGEIPPAPPRPVDPSLPPLTRHLRRAHAAYSRGSRMPWAVEGEREYQRLKKRAQRTRDRERAA